MEKHSKICDLVIGFYRIKETFGGEFDRYHRGGEFNFEVIDAMETDIYRLKNEIHSVFRHGADLEEWVLERESLFDLIIGSIFHEMLHLKEYIYTLQSYEPRYILFEERKKDRKIDSHQDDFLKYSKEIVREARENLPKKAVEVRNLFEDALSLMKGILRKYRTSKRLIRVLYLDRKLLNSIYGENGLELIYGIMYKGGPMEGYFRAGASFLKDGFYEFALRAFEEALNVASGSVQEGELRQEIKKRCQLLQKRHPEIVEVKKLLARI